jgi:hypothetical protein
MTAPVHPEHCPAWAASAVALDDAGLPRSARAAVQDCARVNRSREAQYGKRLRWNLKPSPSKERALPWLDPVELPS